MKIKYLVNITILVIACSRATASLLHKRDYTKKSYYTLHTVYPNDIEAAREAANHLGAQLEGPVGELAHYFWISIPMSTTTTNHHNVIQQFNTYKKRNRKRDVDLVDAIQLQIPKKRLYKRAPPPKLDPIIENKDLEQTLNGKTILLPSLDDNNGFQRMKEALDIKDPGFDKQWHLVICIHDQHLLYLTYIYFRSIEMNAAMM
jgi:kexin